MKKHQTSLLGESSNLIVQLSIDKMHYQLNQMI